MRRGRIDAVIRWDIIETSWGPFLAAATDRGLVGTTLPHNPKGSLADHAAKLWPGGKAKRNLITGLSRTIRDFFQGRPVSFDFPLDLSGMTDFQHAVLQATQRIPYGQTATYADLARAAGRPGASRAVGGVMAGNPLPLIVPCHRVVRSDGGLGGFSAPQGVALKERLLELEGGAAFISRQRLVG